MKRRIAWVLLTCLLVTSIMLSSCGKTTQQQPKLPPKQRRRLIGGINSVSRNTAVRSPFVTKATPRVLIFLIPKDLSA